MIYWENPFSHRVHEAGVGSQPRLVYDAYASRGEGRIAVDDYELARAAEDEYLERSYLDVEQQLPVPKYQTASGSRLNSRSASPRRV